MYLRMSSFRTSRGFTLIELLVVIAIIGILSAVVLASLTTARERANNTAIRSNFDTIRKQAEIYYGNNSSRYGASAVAGTNCGTAFASGTLFADTPISNALAGAYANSGNQALYCVIDSNGAGFAVAIPLKGTGNGYLCVDSTSNTIKSTQGTGSTAYTALSGSATAALSGSTDTTCN